ncbi:MAG TPA: NlpC/P60 family protein [Deltaproteobacteria bacterium]|nr:NlpC/P60 family protein [Deltaproteobacteria bacterium]
MVRNRGSTGTWICTAILVSLLLLPACSARKTAIAPYQPKPLFKPRAVAAQAQKMGYSIQVGAFQNVNNAARLTKKLEVQGIDAFYFAHGSGFFKVRFGNYPTQGAATAETRRMKGRGIIEVFYVIKPGEYAVARGKPRAGISTRDDIVDTARDFVGLPYLWGSSELSAPLDCSGLVLAVYQLNGLNVPRTSAEQYETGTPVDMGDIEKGDLVFFATSGSGRVSHVGIYIGDGKFIHAPGRGKTICADSMSSTYYRERFYGARTYLR